MSKPLEAPPAKAPVSPEFIKPSDISPAELFNLCQDASGLPCRIPVNVGLFFDGTNNPMARDRDGKRALCLQGKSS